METLNSMVPLWQRKKSEVTREEYDKFYQEHVRGFRPAPVGDHRLCGGRRVPTRPCCIIPCQPSGQYYTEDFEPGLQLYSSRRDDHG